MVARKRGGQRAQAASQPYGTAARCAVELPHVLVAVESLYKDQIKPVCRILRKRIVEHSLLSPPRPDLHFEISVEDLRALCMSCGRLVIEIDDTGDWAALLVGRPLPFIDVYGQNDPYGEGLWNELTVYCTGNFGASLLLPGGRYACAVALRARQLPCLAGRSLGEIAHIVQLGLSQRKLLGYSNGAIVPYPLSQSMLKEQCAKSHCPCSSSRDPMLVASWEVARSCLWQILQVSPAGQLPLPNVKRLFRSRFHLDLSETAFGYSKVSELLQDRRFQDICEVELRGHGYVVVQRRPTASVISLAQSLTGAQISSYAVPGQAVQSEVTLPRRVQLCEPLSPVESPLQKDEPVSLAATPTADVKSATWCLTPGTVLALSQDGYRSIVHNTFIQVKRPETPKLPTSRSMPAGFWRGCDVEDQQEPLHSSEDGESSSDTAEVNASTTLSFEEDWSSDSAERELNPLRELLKSLPKGGPHPAGACTPMDGTASSMCEQTRLSALRTPGRKKSERHVNFCLDEPLEDPDCSPMNCSIRTPAQVFPMTPVTPISEYDEPRESPPRMCGDLPLMFLEPLELEPANVQQERGRTGSIGSYLPNLMTPTTMSKEGFEITNTFLNAKRAPPTPFRKQEARRSKSVG